MNFTDRFIRNLKPESKIKDIRGGRGFGIRVRPDGTKVFFYGYNSPVTGSRRFFTLGEYPDLSLEDARIKYGDAYKIVKAGGDPLETKHAEQVAHRNSLSVKELIKEYIDRHAKKNKRSWKEDDRILQKDVVPMLGNRKAHDVTKGDIIILLEKIVDRGAPHAANNTFKILRKLFNWAVEKDRLIISPCMSIKLPTKVESRDRALSVDEIKIFWTALDAGPLTTGTVGISMSNQVKHALKLILITAQRPGEVSGMHTSEIDGDWWTIPSERSKNGKPHRVPLTSFAHEIIAQSILEVKKARDIPLDKEYKGYIFPCPHRAKDKPMERHALSRALKRNEKDGLTLGVAPFTPHDLRRTTGTRLAEMRFMDAEIDALLNHQKEGIIKVYNLYRYDKEKVVALETWERKLKSLITNDHNGKVVPIHKKAANK